MVSSGTPPAAELFRPRIVAEHIRGRERASNKRRKKRVADEFDKPGDADACDVGIEVKTNVEPDLICGRTDRSSLILAWTCAVTSPPNTSSVFWPSNERSMWDAPLGADQSAPTPGGKSNTSAFSKLTFYREFHGQVNASLSTNTHQGVGLDDGANP